uniref:Odorant receptor n=1 Tax=Semiothisa cinerearia TaxID=2249628 RepID=A0A889XL56_9NEOP|nr:odorant receptor [Semiothisa cinerearia]
MKNEHFLKHPKDQRFYKTIALVMGAIGLNTQYWQWFKMPKNVLFRIQRDTLFITVPMSVISQTTYLVLNHSKHEFEALSVMYAVLPVTTIVWIKLYSAQTRSYKLVMENFMTKIHLYNYLTTHENSKYVKKILVEAELFVRWSTFYLVFFCYASCTGFEIVPIVHNFQKFESFKNITERLEIIVHFWLPFDYEYNFNNWVIVQTILFYCGYMCVTIISMFEMINLTCIYHIIGHIKIIKHQIKTSFTNDMTNEEVTKNIIKISRYYNFITESLKDVENAFGFNVASIYLHNLIAGGLLIYHLSMSGTETGTILTYGLMIPLYMGVLIIVSLALEYIRIVASDIPDLIYDLHWESMSVTNQRMLLLVLCQVQPVLEFNAAFNIKTGVQPAIDILKTTFSFYVMIKSTV